MATFHLTLVSQFLHLLSISTCFERDDFGIIGMGFYQLSPNLFFCNKWMKKTQPAVAGPVTQKHQNTEGTQSTDSNQQQSPTDLVFLWSTSSLLREGHCTLGAGFVVQYPTLSRVCAVAQYAVLEANGKVNGIGEISDPSPSQTLGPIWMWLQIYDYVPPGSRCVKFG